MKPRAINKTIAGKRSGLKKNRRPDLLRANSVKVKIPPSLVLVKDILVPVDFSKPSEKALQYALAFARQFDAKLRLVYVVEPSNYTGFEASPLILNDNQAIKSAKEKLTVLQLRQKEGAAYIKEVRAVVGKPFQEITRLASSLKCDLIVIATHGRTGLKHVLMGSTAEKVVRHAPCPVLVVRQNEREIIRTKAS